jgi:antitoxin FitA
MSSKAVALAETELLSRLRVRCGEKAATCGPLIFKRCRGDAIILQAMMNLLVRDVPDDVHRVLQRRAKSHGQSLQQYLSSELTRIAERPSLAEVLDRIDRRSGGEVGLARAAKDVAEERGQR